MSILHLFEKYYFEYGEAKVARFNEGIIPRLGAKEGIFFTPLGPRYDFDLRGDEILAHHAEMKLLEFLSNWLKTWPAEFATPTTWIFLAADYYGTDINRLPAAKVNKYFISFEEKVKSLMGSKAKFVKWSEEREKATAYRETAQSRYSMLRARTLGRAELIAARKGGDAKQYLVERITEALYMEAKFKPIKISCANPQDDGDVDMHLPRLYVVPEHLRKPWRGAWENGSPPQVPTSS